MQKILIVVDAPGPAEFIEPVLRESRISNHKLRIVTVKDSPTKILAKYRPTRCDTEAETEKIYKKFQPDLLIVAVSSLILGPYVNNKFTELAHRDGKKIIAFQDIWANHRWPMNFKMIKYWDTIFTIDEMAEHLLRQDGYKGKIIVTGNPSFDKLRNINVSKERIRLRRKLKIPQDAFVILHTGTGTPQSWREDETTFKFLAQAVSSLKKNHNSKILLITTPHPRDEDPGRYRRLAPNLDFIQIDNLPVTDQLLPVADVITAMYATNLVHACYLRIPAVSILLPNAGMKRLKKIHLPDFPPNAVGATIGIYKKSIPELIGIFERLIANSAYRAVIQKFQTRFFPFYKESAAIKISNVILTFLRMLE